MTNIVFSFKNNNEEYIVIKKDINYIACKKENSELSLLLTEEEKKMVNTIFLQLKVKNHLRLSNIKFEGKEYQHYYDKENNFHTFLTVDGNKLTKDEFSKLNLEYNYIDEYVYFEMNKKANKFVQRLVKYGKVTVIVFMLSSCLIPNNAALKAYAKETNTFDVVTEVNTFDESVGLTDEEKIANLKEALASNKNLTDEEKEFFLSGFKIAEDNIDVIDYEETLFELQKLKIEYIEGSSGGPAGAKYFSNGNEATIKIYNSTCFADCPKIGLSHEFCHLFQAINKCHLGLYEPLNSMANSEYFKKYDSSYNFSRPYIETLIQIIGFEPLRQYNFSGDISYVENALKTIIDDEEKIYDLLNKLDAYTSPHANYGDEEPIEIEDSLNDFYTAKYNKSMFTNPFILSKLYGGIHINNLVFDEIKDNENIKEEFNTYHLTSEVRNYYDKSAYNYAQGPETYLSYIETKTYDALNSREQVEKHIKEMYGLTLEEAFKEGLVKETSEEEYLSYKHKSNITRRVIVDEEYLEKSNSNIDEQIKQKRLETKKIYEDYKYEKKLSEINSELLLIKNTFKVNKIKEDEKLIYQNKKGKYIVNINSKYAKKINEYLASGNYKCNYNIIPELNIMSIEVKENIKENSSKYVGAYNINLSNGKSYNIKNYLKQYGAPESFYTDIDSVYLNRISSNIIETTTFKHANGEYNNRSVAIVKYEGPLRKDNGMEGPAFFDSNYAREINAIVKESFGDNYYYKYYDYDDFISLQVQNNGSFLSFRIDPVTLEEYDKSKVR